MPLPAGQLAQYHRDGYPRPRLKRDAGRRKLIRGYSKVTT
jgi:hypothetical protein